MLRTPIALLAALLLALTPSFLYSQCLTAPPPDDCLGTEPLPVDNSTLNLTDKKWHYGAAAVFNQLTLKGGTLVVCSDLTINNFFMDSGIVMVRPGAKLKIGGGAGVILRGNAAIYNYGTLEVTSNLSLDNNWASLAKPNVVINATSSAVFKMSNQYFVINNPYSFFVNKGKSEFWGLITDYNAGAGSVCLGSASETKMTVLYNNSKNTYIAPYGNACVHVNQYSQFRDTLTAVPTVLVCLGATHVSDATCIPLGCKPNAWGTSNLFQLCNACGDIAVLDIKLLDFEITNNTFGYILSWKTNKNAANYIFNVERSTDGVAFYPLDSIIVSAAGNRTNFSSKDVHPPVGTLYYRVNYRQVVTGKQYSSNIIKAIYTVNSNKVVISPNPFYTGFQIVSDNGRNPQFIVVTSKTGAIVYSKKVTVVDGGNIIVSLPTAFAAGEYFVKLVYANEVLVRKIIKAR